MAFTAKDVQALRERTGCGMMDCKKALTEADGDMDKAVELLREKGLAAAAKKAGRIAAEGMVYCATNEAGDVGVILEVNAETDFVAKNAEFQAFVKTVADTILEKNPADVEALGELQAVGTEMTVAELLRDKILTIGENIKIRRFVRMEGVVYAYAHTGNRIGVLVKLDAEGVDIAAAKAAAKNIALHITMYNPQYVDKSQVPEETVAKEKEILIYFKFKELDVASRL